MISQGWRKVKDSGAAEGQCKIMGFEPKGIDLEEGCNHSTMR